MTAVDSLAKTPKYQAVLETLRTEIMGGVYPAGKRLPSEADLEKRFGASRITVGRAMHELRTQNLIERRAGSGTFVRAAQAGASLFGLLIPNLGQSEIFEPIVQGMADSPQAARHSLIWGGMGSRDTTPGPVQMWELCQQYIEQKVAGVFFAPLEFYPADPDCNRRVAEAFMAAKISVVLLDRDFVPYPERGPFDLVGIDNRRAGYLAADHLFAQGCRRFAFVAKAHAAPTVGARIAGYQEALMARKIPLERAAVGELDPSDRDAVADLLRAVDPQGIVCATDGIAGALMHTLFALGRRVPDEIRIVGIDDVGYAKLLPVPLTSVRQPCREIGISAMSAMIERMERPRMPARDILLSSELVVRASSAAVAA